ncbi:MAG: hypothetical protein KF760_19270 [Candidatus Eremiobacteraeota bacterium]|nr:hypothetical protein [Candidatus Eremiobacteraeota bacterium]MCW5868344.1 hypothetical protein [Candidatus Eremiobacteraeota bacterium]
MNGDEAPKKFKLASQRERDALDEGVERVLIALGHEGALVTDESLVADFLESGGQPYCFRRGQSGPWLGMPGDPAIDEKNKRILSSVSAELGVPLTPDDFLVDVARRLCGGT